MRSDRPSSGGGDVQLAVPRCDLAVGRLQQVEHLRVDDERHGRRDREGDHGYDQAPSQLAQMLRERHCLGRGPLPAQAGRVRCRAMAPGRAMLSSWWGRRGPPGALPSRSWDEPRSVRPSQVPRYPPWPSRRVRRGRMASGLQVIRSSRAAAPNSLCPLANCFPLARVAVRRLARAVRRRLALPRRPVRCPPPLAPRVPRPRRKWNSSWRSRFRGRRQACSGR